MNLFSLSVFSESTALVKRGWYFEGRVLSVIGPNRRNILCRRVQRHSIGNSNLVHCGNLSHNHMLVKDVCPGNNSDQFLLSIVNDGFIKIPFELYDRVSINGERSRCKKMAISIIRLNKSDKTEFIIHVPGQKNRSITVSYDFESNRLVIEDHYIQSLPKPESSKKRSLWNRIKNIFQTCFGKFYKTHQFWRV